MKAFFVVLAILISAEWMKREACETGRHGWQRMDEHAANSEVEVGGSGDQRPGNEYGIPVRKKKTACQGKRYKPSQRALHKERTTHLLVVGAGTQLVALLAALLGKKKPATCVRIVIVETKSKFPYDLAYDNDVVIPQHLMYVHVLSGISITYKDDYDFDIESDSDTDSVVDDDNEKSFAHWVSRYPDLYKLDGNLNQQELPPPRYLYGQYLEWRFNELVGELKGKYDIRLIESTSADNISIADDDSKLFIVTLSDGSKVRTLDIFLATGHWSNNHFGEEIVDGFYPSPWPASDLTHRVTGIPAHAKVGILGDGINAIDATLTLAHGHGNFTDNEDGSFTFKPNSPSFHITIYSPNGRLPAVSGKTSKYEATALEELEERIEEIQQNDEEYPTLDDVMNAMRSDLVVLAEDIPGIDQIEYTSAAQFIRDLDYLIYQGKQFPNDRLRKDTNGARDSWQNTRSTLVLVQSFFMDVEDYFNRFMQYFKKRDKFTFRESVAPFILGFITPMPLRNAEKLLAMIEDRYLQIIDCGRNVKVEKDPNNEGVRVKFRKLNTPHRYFVDAREQSGDIKRNPSPLVQSLLNSGFIQQPLLPLTDDMHVQDEKRVETVSTNKKQKLESGEAKNVEQRFYRLDGIHMNMEQMTAIPSVDMNEIPGFIYASGPFTLADYAFPESIKDVKFFGQRFAKEITQFRFQEYSKLPLGKD